MEPLLQRIYSLPPKVFLCRRGPVNFEELTTLFRFLLHRHKVSIFPRLLARSQLAGLFIRKWLDKSALFKKNIEPVKGGNIMNKWSNTKSDVLGVIAKPTRCKAVSVNLAGNSQQLLN